MNINRAWVEKHWAKIILWVPAKLHLAICWYIIGIINEHCLIFIEQAGHVLQNPSHTEA